MKYLIFLIVAFLNVKANAGECSQTTQVCGCQTVCANFVGTNSQSNLPQSLGSTPKLSFTKQSPYAKPYSFCNAFNPRECIIIYR